MIKYYHCDGSLIAAEAASLRVNDLAVLRGYGIFDYFLVHNRQPMFIEDYLDRFERSAAKLHLAIPASRTQLREYIFELIDANGLHEGGIRLLLTGGYSEDGYQPSVRPNLLILQYPPRPSSLQPYETGVKLLSYPYQRELPEVKSINYLMGIYLLPELRRAGAHEPLYHDGRYLRETVRANFFLVDERGRVVTPKDKILLGVTRRKILELARNYFEVEEREITREELLTAREAFLTGSNKKILPVVRVDDIVLGKGKPGPVTRHLMELFDAFVMEYQHNPAGKFGL
jgi:branched-chain amino acid aminotransferase